MKHSANNSIVDTSLVDLDELGSALNHVRNTLEELTISACCDSGNNIYLPVLDIKGSLKALVDFEHLKKLEIPLQFLIVSFEPAEWVRLKDVVPMHIQSLVITDDLDDQEQNECDDDALYELIKSWAQDRNTPKHNLRTIELLLKKTDVYWGAEMRNMLKELCNECHCEAKVTKFLVDYVHSRAVLEYYGMKDS